jgi:hypothetical protein
MIHYGRRFALQFDNTIFYEKPVLSVGARIFAAAERGQEGMNTSVTTICCMSCRKCDRANKQSTDTSTILYQLETCTYHTSMYVVPGGMVLVQVLTTHILYVLYCVLFKVGLANRIKSRIVDAI